MVNSIGIRICLWILLGIAVLRPVPVCGATAYGRGLIWGIDWNGRYHRFLSDSSGIIRERVDNGGLVALTGVSSSSPASAASGANQLALAWRGADNTLSYRILQGDAWGATQNGGGQLLGSPVPVYLGGTLHIFCLAADGTIRQWSGGAWVDNLPLPTVSPFLRFAEVPYVFTRNNSLVLWATGEDGISTWEASTSDGAAFTAWKRIAAAPSDTLTAYLNGKGPMTVHNYSGSSDAHALHILALGDASFGIEEKTEGRTERTIGFARAKDRFFVGKYYAVFMDQTGFYGEPNGFWPLNGRTGVELDFVVAPNGEPVSSFIPGEMNDGKWGPGYDGAEHIEVPWQDYGQWGLSGAGYMYGAASTINWWRTCNGKGVQWTDYFAPILNQKTSNNSLDIKWEGRFVKVADYTAGNTGVTCGEDPPFSNVTGGNHPVYLRTGLELFGDQPKFQRKFQYRNGEGNPPFSTVFGIVTGIALGFSPPKRPEHDLFWLKSNGVDWKRYPDTVGTDIINCSDPTLSRFNHEVYGYAFQSGGCSCFCFQHGGIELGSDAGAGTITNLAAGQTSREGVNTFRLLGTPPDPSVRTYTIPSFKAIPILPGHGKPAPTVRWERYPNEIIFRGDGAQDEVITVRDVNGKSWFAAAQAGTRSGASGNRRTWDISKVPGGIYFYTVGAGADPGKSRSLGKITLMK